MLLLDSHVHFDSAHAAGDLEAVLERARTAGVTRMVGIGGSTAANALALSLAERYGPTIRVAVGYDRDEATDSPDLPLLEEQAAHAAVAAIGEIGLDYYYSAESADAQKVLFQQMLALAVRRTLPVVVHSRDADEDTLTALTEYVKQWQGEPERVGVLHCFTGSMEFAEQLLPLGMMISFSGIITFRNAEALRAVAARVPDDRLLIETDTPYLAPVPFRGKTNEPARLIHVAEQLAAIRHCSVEHIADITTRNAQKLFGLAGEDSTA